MTRFTKTSYPQLRHMFACYFDQDCDSEEEALQEYLREPMDEVLRPAYLELSDLISKKLTEVELHNLLEGELCLDIIPASSYSAWLSNLQTRIGHHLGIQPTPRQPPPEPPVPSGPPPPSYTPPPPQPTSSAGWFVLGAICLAAAIAFFIYQQTTSTPRPQQQAVSPQASPQQPVSMPISRPANSATTTAFEESFAHAPDYDDNWVIASQAGSFTTTYTSGNFRIQAPPVTTAGNGGSGVTFRSKQGFVGDFDASFQLNHEGYGRTTVGLWSANSNQVVIQSILDTNDTAFLNFVSGPMSTEYTYSSAPYMNTWITLRIQIVGSVVNFYADNGTGPQLLKTWPVPTSTSDTYYLVFGAASVAWKAGPNDTSFRRISVLTPAPATPNPESPPPIRYTADVYRVDNTRYHLTVPRTDDWFDTGIPVVVDQEVNVYQANEQWHINVSNRERFAVRLLDSDGASVAGPVGLSDWGVSLTPFTPQLPYDFLGSIKVKILSDVPAVTLLVIVQDTTLRAGNCGPFAAWMSERNCPGYTAARQTAVSKAGALIEQIPLR